MPEKLEKPVWKGEKSDTSSKKSDQKTRHQRQQTYR